jgi:amino acid transporter
LDALARGAWGAGWVLVFLAIANSAIASANASANAATRMWFALGRIRVLPRPLEHVNPRWRSPDVAVVVQFVVGVVVSVWLGLQYEPLTAFALVGTIVTAVIIAIYMVVNLACLVFYLREGRSEFNPLLHGLVPLLGILAFLPAFLTVVGIQAFDFRRVQPGSLLELWTEDASGAGRSGLPGGGVPLRQPADGTVLRRGGRARGHPGHPLRVDRAVAGLGRLCSRSRWTRSCGCTRSTGPGGR